MCKSFAGSDARLIQRHSLPSVHIVQPLANAGFVCITLSLQCVHCLPMQVLIDEDVNFIRSWINQRQRIATPVQRVGLFDCELYFRGLFVS